MVRSIHAFVESKQEFANWIKNRINEYGFIEKSRLYYAPQKNGAMTDAGEKATLCDKRHDNVCREIAELCDKEHRNVCRDIDNLNATYGQMGKPIMSISSLKNKPLT